MVHRRWYIPIPTTSTLIDEQINDIVDWRIQHDTGITYKFKGIKKVRDGTFSGTIMLQVEYEFRSSRNFKLLFSVKQNPIVEEVAMLTKSFQVMGFCDAQFRKNCGPNGEFTIKNYEKKCCTLDIVL